MRFSSNWKSVFLCLLTGSLCNGCTTWWSQSSQHTEYAECDTSECEPKEYHALGGYNPLKDRIVTKSAAKRCAEQALTQIYRSGESRQCEDFEDGFTAAYVDMAMGEDGQVPAVPPQKYWAAAYRTRRGHALAQEWFTGYQAGAESFRQRGLDQYQKLPNAALVDQRVAENIDGHQLETLQSLHAQFPLENQPVPGTSNMPVPSQELYQQFPQPEYHQPQHQQYSQPEYHHQHPQAAPYSGQPTPVMPSHTPPPSPEQWNQPNLHHTPAPATTPPPGTPLQLQPQYSQPQQPALTFPGIP